MICEKNLRIVKCQYGACHGSGDVQALDPAHAPVFVNCRRLEPICKLIARPLLQLAILHEFDSGVRRKCLADKIAVPGCMSPKVQLNSISWADLCPARGRRK